MSAIHEITEAWQREGLSPTWLRLQQAKAEHDALTAEVADLREKLAKKAELLRGCYAADHKRKKQIQLADELEAMEAYIVKITKDKSSAVGFLSRAGIIDANGELAEQFRNIIEVNRAALKEDKTC